MPCVCRVARENFPDAQSCCSPRTRHTQGMPLRDEQKRNVVGREGLVGLGRISLRQLMRVSTSSNGPDATQDA